MADSASSHEHLSVGALAEFTDQWHFSHVVRARGLLFLSGVTGTDVEGHVDPDPARQFNQAFVQMRQYLAAAGADIGDLVEMTTYHVGLRRHLEAFIAVKDRHLQHPYPAWSAIGVSELITPRALLEIRAVASDPQATT